MWGSNDTQAYYERGRQISVVHKYQIHGYCRCGYLTLNPDSELDDRGLGLTVKRSTVTIINEQGNIVQKLRGVLRWYGCNACVNNWR